MSWVTVRLVCSLLMFLSSILILAYGVQSDLFGVRTDLLNRNLT